MSRLTGDLFEITELSHHGPEDVVIAFLTIVGALIFMFSVEWRLAIVVALLIPIFLMIVILTRRNFAQASVNVKKRMADINADAESCISGIKTSKAFANQDVDNERFTKANSVFKGAKSNYYKAMGTFNASQEFFMCIMPVVTIAVGGKLIMDGRMNYIDLITFTLFVSSFITPIRRMANFAEVFANGTAGLKRFMEIMSVEPAVKELPNAAELTVREGRIDVEKISFAYNDRREVIHELSLHVRPGETLAVVGHSGGGKTTLCQLIPRFYDVESGAIKIDGQDIREVSKKSLAENIGIVQQDVYLFNGTVKENIAYGRLDATMDEIVEAARNADLLEFIESLPNGFDTQVGERGARLSGGQKQRIAIARVFLKNPPILILDEATSALDNESERYIQESLDKLSVGRTTITIAHRLSTILGADEIIVLDEDGIKERGNHKELIKKGGLYEKYYRMQLGTI